MKDVVNQIDVVSSNNIQQDDHRRNGNRRRETFSFNARGRKGIGFIFFPSLGSLQISIRYNQLVVSNALYKLIELGIAITHKDENRPLKDEELERLKRG